MSNVSGDKQGELKALLDACNKACQVGEDHLEPAFLCDGGDSSRKLAEFLLANYAHFTRSSCPPAQPVAWACKEVVSCKTWCGQCSASFALPDAPRQSAPAIAEYQRLRELIEWRVKTLGERVEHGRGQGASFDSDPYLHDCAIAQSELSDLLAAFDAQERKSALPEYTPATKEPE